MKLNLAKSLQMLLLFLLLVSCSSDSGEAEVVKEKEEQQRPIGEFIDDWTYKIFPENPYNNFDVGEFRVWVPDSSTNLKAILVLLTSSNGNALGLAGSIEWQTYAEQEKLVICSVNLKSSAGTGYREAGGGSGQAMIDAIEKVAEKNNIPHLSSLPFLFRGYSAGGVFAYNFSAFEPDRTIAFVNIRGGSIGDTSSQNVEVPGLILSGELEGADRSQFLREFVLDKRNDGGLWSFAEEPDAGHFDELYASDSLARTFFSGILKNRFLENNDQLRTIPNESGWLGNITGTEAFPYAEYPGNKNRANWLVDEEFAEAWLKYQK